jgi:integrase
MRHRAGAMKRPTPQKINGKPSTPWRVRIPKAFVQADPDTGKKRDLRKFFASRSEALDYIARGMDPKIGWAKADEREHAVEIGKISLSRAISDFLTLRYRPEQMVNNVTLKQERQILKAFSGHFGNPTIDSFTRREINSWLRAMDKSPRTIHHHFAIVRRFFNWCEEEELLTGRNPIRSVKAPEVPRSFPTTISPEAMAKFLEAARQLPDEHYRRQMLSYLCLGGFAGLRTSEIKRLRWEDINWREDNGHVHVQQPKCGDARNVTILPVLRRHLEGCALQSGPVLTWAFNRAAKLRAELEKRADGLELPDNCLRHCFASYHIAMWRNWEETAFEMGHTSPKMTKAKYVKLMDKPVAEQWWAL